MVKKCSVMAFAIMALSACMVTTSESDLYEACIEKGYAVARTDGVIRCETKYVDTGNVCTDHSDCIGGCVKTDKFVPVGASTVGQCSARNMWEVCIQMVENHIASVVMCPPTADESQSEFEKELEISRREAYTAMDKAACFESGGVIEAYGMFDYAGCVHYHPDGGNSCTDSSECEGQCGIYESFVAPGELVFNATCTGSSKKGCFQEVQLGKGLQAICQD